jgi:hypothetical protein
MASFILFFTQFLELALDVSWSVQDLESEMRVAFQIQSFPGSLQDALKLIVQNREI